MRKPGTLCKKYSVSNQLTDRLTGEDVLETHLKICLWIFSGTAQLPRTVAWARNELKWCWPGTLPGANFEQVPTFEKFWTRLCQDAWPREAWHCWEQRGGVEGLSSHGLWRLWRRRQRCSSSVSSHQPMVADAGTLQSFFDSRQTVLKIYLDFFDSDLMLICRIALTRRDAALRIDGETIKK